MSAALVPNIQTLDISALSTDRTQLETRLSELHGQIRLNHIEAGRIISELRKSSKHGEWMPYSEKLFRRLKISRKSAERYVDAYQKAKDIGEAIVAEAEVAGLNVNRIPVREALLEAKRNNPTADAAEIVNLTNLKLQDDGRKNQPAPKPSSSSAADFIAVITTLRSELTGVNQFVKQIENGSADCDEARTLVAALKALADDAQQRAKRLTDLLNRLQEKAA